MPPLLKVENELWDTMLDLAAALPETWTLIGGQMVMLHALEHDAPPTRVSADLDALVNLRAVTGSIPAFVIRLEGLGFAEDGASPDRIAHRYRRGDICVDVLAPDGLGPRADLRTKPPSRNRTIEVPGGTQALRRTELLPVTVGDRHGAVPRPSLLGAIVTKAEAVNVDDVPDAQRNDLVLLLSLVPDPFDLAGQLDRKDRQRLARRRELLKRGHRAWDSLDTDAADRGHATLRLLTVDAD